MNINGSGDNITDLLQTFLDVQSRRSEVTAGNIANADTPGYLAKELDFQDYLKNAAEQSALPLSKQQEQGLANEPRVVDQKSDAIGIDGNTVDLGKEMADLAAAGSDFNFGAKMLQDRFRVLRLAIREGK